MNLNLLHICFYLCGEGDKGLLQGNQESTFECDLCVSKAKMGMKSCGSYQTIKRVKLEKSYGVLSLDVDGGREGRRFPRDS